MKKVLIITYYWPPSGGAGVQRWLKFVKYLRDFGWEPVIYTPENPEVPAEDNTLFSDIPEGIQTIKTKIWEPYSFYKQFVGRKKDDKIKTGFVSEKKTPSFTENISVWIRGNFFIPDARKYWIKPSVKFLSNYLKDHHVDAIISTGPPHSMHMIAIEISSRLNIPWLADFRDPWTKIDFYHQLKLTKGSDIMHHRMERAVLENATKLVTVSWNWAKDFEGLGAKNMEVVTNGFDPDDYKHIKSTKNEKFEITHVGSLNKDRNPLNLWKALEELCEQNQNFNDLLKIKLIGQTDHSVIEELKTRNLIKFVETVNYMPHKEVLEVAGRASVLLLPLNDTPHVSGIVPGKIFEYLALKRPILCIGPVDGDSARIITECNAGKVVGFEDKESLKSVTLSFFDSYLSDSLENASNHEVDKYSRRILAGQIATLLNDITKDGNQKT